MSFWFEETAAPSSFTAAGGEATLPDIWAAAREQMQLVDNSNSAYSALYRSYDDRIAAIEAATGEKLSNPLSRAEARDREKMLAPKNDQDELEAIFSGRPKAPSAIDEETAAFSTRLNELAEKYPEAAAIIRAGTPVDRDAEALARHADEKLGALFSSREGIGKWAAVFGGGFSGSMRDPLQVITLFAGGGAGAARTVAGRVAQTALREALVNGAAEAALQPSVQAWREQAGLPHGFDEALKNVAFAAGAGGILGGGLQGIGDVAARFAGKAETRPAVIDALTGDGDKALEVLAPIRQALPAEARGALDAAELIRIDTDARPKAARPDMHEQTVTAAMRAAQDNAPFITEADPVQIARIVDRLVPDEVAAPSGEQTLQQFLMASGGIRDFKGELEAIGVSNLSERFVGRLVREDGMALDEARRAAAEAGFFSHLYGTADEAAAKSTINDLLDELDTATRASGRDRASDGGRVYAEGLVSDLVERAGPAVDDDLIIKAADLVNRENIDPADALDRVLIAADREAASADAPDRAAGRAADPAERTGGLDDPGAAANDDMLFSPRDLEELDEDFDIPFFDDDAPASGAAMMDELQRLDDIAALVEACRV